MAAINFQNSMAEELATEANLKMLKRDLSNLNPPVGVRQLIAIIKSCQFQRKTGSGP